MKIKKQFVIVPPMSDPFQKLNEVLQGVAEDENIDISIIDDPKEFMQFVASAGQVLVAFSNAKKCVTFLQDNRLFLIKHHSKVILLTPVVIPEKTLVKFVKLGLTEAILESSPPKNLFYKVKLLLRSIKSSSPQENKDQVVKSMIDLNQPTTLKNDFIVEKDDENKDKSLDQLPEELTKKKKGSDQKLFEDSASLNAKKNYQEESIDTNWKSKAKRETLDFSNDESSSQKTEKTEIEDSNDIDMYYRSKKEKKNSFELLEEAASRTKKNIVSDELPEDSYQIKKNAESALYLEASPVKNKKSHYIEEGEGVLSVKSIKDSFVLPEAAESPKKEKFLTEEEKLLAKKKEFEELDSLFEAAKKRQAEEAQSLDEEYKGKIGSSKLDLDAGQEDREDASKDKNENENSDLYQREKQSQLDLIEAAAKEKKRIELDNSKRATPLRAGVDNNGSDIMGENAPSDKIVPPTISELNKDGSKKVSTLEISAAKLKKKEKTETEDEANYTKSKKDKNDLEAADEDLKKQKENVIYEKDEATDRKKQSEIDLESTTAKRTKKSVDNDIAFDEDDFNHNNDKGLQLVDGNIERSKSTIENAEKNMSFKKLNQTELELDTTKDRNSYGKVDNIDTFYRSSEAKKSDHSWDNLTEKNKFFNLEIEKGKRRENEISVALLRKDAGEITIDYRKLKQEFDHMARSGSSGEAGRIENLHSEGLDDTEEAGPFKVIEVDARGFEFSIELVNLIYQKDSKAVDFYKKISEELISHYNAYPVFYTFKTNDKKHIEAFDSFMHFGASLISTELKEWWINNKKEQAVFNDYFEKTMTTWLCREIEAKSGNGSYWEDIELPSWAANELTNKKVEMVFPYFDGLDRMGAAIVIFPEGVNPTKEKSIMVTLEMARTMLLDSIQRKVAEESPKEEDAEEPATGKKNMIGMFSGFFNRNKTG